MAFAEKRRTWKDSSSVALVMKTATVSTDGNTHEVIIPSCCYFWSELKPVKKAHLDGHRPMNPCPVYEKTSQTLFLFFICVEGNISERWQIKHDCNKARLCYITTTDDGHSWSGVTDLTNPLVKEQCWATFAVGPGHGLQTEAGRLIVPLYAYDSPKTKPKADPTPHARSLYSDDNGKTWQLGEMLQHESLECEMAEFFDEKQESSIYCNARTTGGKREEAVSRNNGKDFSELSPRKLPETGKGCQGSVVSFPAQGKDTESQNKWLLFSHPESKSKRINLGVYLNKSPGNPKTWSKLGIINKGPSGYSDLVYIDDGWFACLMECRKRRET
ncbi:sialidase-3-like [Centropristis striata]|uniref:sialidase-3-like n=1 Tax=Centropristis striata TaxID=184440 RepID=UPI0027E071D2|nr:sialidase-3-like [Centropristis striata]